VIAHLNSPLKDATKGSATAGDRTYVRFSLAYVPRLEMVPFLERTLEEQVRGCHEVSTERAGRWCASRLVSVPSAVAPG
jgi:hypothetical protein